MKYILDTNICIYAIKKKVSIITQILSHRDEEICISSITYAELLHGVEKSQAVERNRLALVLFLAPIKILPFSCEAAEEYGKIRAFLEKQGTPIGPMDLLIAAHAKAEKAILVTHNTKEFLRVNGLQIEDWAEEA